MEYHQVRIMLFQFSIDMSFPLTQIDLDNLMAELGKPRTNGGEDFVDLNYLHLLPN